MAASVTGKIPLKEKLITYYEQLLEGKDFSEKKNEFWEEFFLLKVIHNICTLPFKIINLRSMWSILSKR
jgi:hypothetical protein